MGYLKRLLSTFSLWTFFFLFGGYVSLLLPSLRGETLTIIHSNDIHGTFQPQRMMIDDHQTFVGGMAAVSHHLNRLRASEKNMLLFDLGDIMTGTLAATIEYKGVVGGAMIEFLNRLGYNLWCLGNHEFDRGQENALELARLAKFPTLMANIVYSEDRRLFPVQPYHILKAGTVKVAVIAVIEENFLEEVHIDKIQGLDVLPIVPTLNSYIPMLNEKADLVVVLVHSLFSEGLRVARDVPGVDVVLVASEDGRFEDVNGVLVKSTIGHLKTLGYLKLEVENGKIKDYEESLILLWADKRLKPSLEITEFVKEVEQAIGEECAEVIGEAKVEMKMRNYPTETPLVESPLGNWITDVMRWKTGADIGLHNSGAIRANLPAGPISIADIFKVSPFQNNLVLFTMTAEQIKSTLERDIERGRDRLQVSGLKYKYYPRNVKPLGQRVEHVEISGDLVVKQGRVIQPQRTFMVVSNDYVAGHAEDKYFGFVLTGLKISAVTLDQALTDWLRENKILEYNLEDRIVEIRLKFPLDFTPRGD